MSEQEKIAPKRAVFGRFKLLQGVHSEGGKTYTQGDVFDSASDLCLHNGPGSRKFMSADEVTKTEPKKEIDETSSEDGFDEMSMEELRNFAEEGDLSLEGCGNSKVKIIARLRASAE